MTSTVTPSLEGSLRRDLNELPQVCSGSFIHRHIFKDMNWPSLMVYCEIYLNEKGKIWIN